MKQLKLAVFFGLSVIFLATGSAFAQKMNAADIVAKHLESIGSKEKRAEVKNQLAFGDVQFKLQGSAVVLNGKIIMVSEGEKNLWGMNLNSNQYPLDRFSYDGKATKVGYTVPGSRSILGDFIYSYRELLKEGLLGGTLLSSWALLNTDSKNAKLSYDGTEKVGAKDAYVLNYQPRGGSDLNVKLYFDKENHRHIRTEYSRVIGARQGATIGGSVAQIDNRVNSSASQGEDRYRLIEEFSDFKKAGNLTMPSVYKIFYSYTSSTSTQSAKNPNRNAEWTFNITNVSYNQQIDTNSFDIDAK